MAKTRADIIAAIVAKIYVNGTRAITPPNVADILTDMVNYLGVQWRGQWANGTTYSPGDFVSNAAIIWISKAVNVGAAPFEGSPNWDVLFPASLSPTPRGLHNPATQYYALDIVSDASNGLYIATLANIGSVPPSANWMTIFSPNVFAPLASPAFTGTPTAPTPTALDSSTKLATTAFSGNASNLTSGTVAAARGGAGTITGALKGSGAGVVTQAAAADLSNGVTGSGAVALATSAALTTPAISGGTINNAIIGGTTSAAGTFTTLTIAGTVTNYLAGAGAVTTQALGEGSTTVTLQRSSADASAGVFIARKSRGTLASPASVSTSDEIGRYSFNAYAGGGFVSGGYFSSLVKDSAPSGTSMETSFTFNLSVSGSVTPIEVMRLEAGVGLSMFGTNPVIDANRVLRLRSYTIGTLPAASTAAGQAIYISDLGGGGGQAVSDGTNWRLSREENYNANATTTGAVTLAALTDANIQLFTTTLTGNLTLTYGTTNAYKGMKRLTASPAALGGFTFTASGKALTASQWVTHVYDGAAWQEMAFGSL
jgi:hypothetical protein